MAQFDEKDLERRFAFHAADEPTGQVHDNVRASIHGCAQDLCELIPPGRELALVLTSLEEAMMWGNAGVARAAADAHAADDTPGAGAPGTSVASGDAGATASAGSAAEGASESVEGGS